VTAVTLVTLTTVKLAAGTPPIETALVERRLLPLIVMVVPPPTARGRDGRDDGRAETPSVEHALDVDPVDDAVAVHVRAAGIAGTRAPCREDARQVLAADDAVAVHIAEATPRLRARGHDGCEHGGKSKDHEQRANVTVHR
jgi:hypothetical protein